MAGTAECRCAGKVITGEDHDHRDRPDGGADRNQFTDMLLNHSIEI